MPKDSLRFIKRHYDQEYPEERQKPELDVLVGGYYKRKQVPPIYRIFVKDGKLQAASHSKLSIVFGGQMQEIQRIVFGTDRHNEIKLIFSVNELFAKYRDHLQRYLSHKGISKELPESETLGNDLRLFEDWNLDQFEANWDDFSEQNASERVSCFVT